MSKRVANRSGPSRNRNERRAWLNRLHARDTAILNAEFRAKKQAYHDVVKRMEDRERYSMRGIAGRFKEFCRRNLGGGK